MYFYLASLGVLAAAPLMYFGVKKVGRNFFYLEHLLFFVIAGLVILHIVPESFQSSRYLALLMVLIGWLLPTLLEKFLHRFESKVHFVPVALAVIGLSLHGFVDGTSLALGSHFAAIGNGELHIHAVPLAVILHRIPASLFLWWLIYPKYGSPVASAVLLLLGVFTSLGFFLTSDIVVDLHNDVSMGLFQALVGGSLLHLASHRISH